MAELSKKELSDNNVHSDIYLTGKEKTDNWELIHGDCVELIKTIPDNSIDYSIFSPPFASLFTYSNSIRDMGNCKSKNDFLNHFQFMLKDLLRIIVPGHLVSIHCMDLPATMTHDGYMGIKDFPGDIIFMMEKAGFIYHSRVCIWKDPLVQATRTKVLSLAHKQISKDSSRCAQGLPDYICTFRKPGDNPKPVAKGRGFESYQGEKAAPHEMLKTDNPRTNKFSHKIWQRYASPVWFDIKQTDTLNARIARSDKDEKHICPLQLGTIARCLDLWTNQGDVVFSPFAGIGSEGFQALKMGRKFKGIELKKAYFDVAIKNLIHADENSTEQLFFNFGE